MQGLHVCRGSSEEEREENEPMQSSENPITKKKMAKQKGKAREKSGTPAIKKHGGRRKNGNGKGKEGT